MRQIALAASFGLACAGCGDRLDRVEITETREADPHRPPPAAMTSAERFGFSAQLPPGHPPLDGEQLPDSGGEGSRSSDIAWDLPDGWVQAPPRPMRVATFLAGDDQSVECYVSELAGGGGLEANLNRWCRQMGNSPLDDSAIQDLPQITVLGQSAPLLELHGDYQGMRGGVRKDSLLFGTIAVSGTRTLFVKMIGPEALAAGQRDAFVAFCESLRFSPDQNTM